MIRIRRQYPEIFEYFPDDHRNSNICKVSTDRNGMLQAYARFRNGKAVLVVPNNGKSDETFRITIPVAEAELPEGKAFHITDLMSGKTLGTAQEEFSAAIPAGVLGVFLIQ